MDIYYYAIFTIFAVILYMMYVDKNVSDYIILLSKILRLNIERFFWMIKYHPKNFITTWFQNRKYNKIAEKLEKEFMEKQSQ